MRRIILILVFVFASLPAVFDRAYSQLIVAHRGASHDAPENTIAAFRLAWEQQADAIEGDFYLTKDKQIVCIHDKSTKRVAPHQCERFVGESTLACLRSVDVGSWKGSQFACERIPTLTEVLDTVPVDKQIFVEIKCGPEILRVLKCQLCSSGLSAQQIVIICFNPSVVAEARSMMPQYKCNWLTSYDQQSQQTWTPSREEVLKTLARTGATGLGTQANLSVLGSSFVGALRAANKEFHAWTINEAADAKILKSLGVDSITTDRPAYIRNAIAPVKSQNMPCDSIVQ